MKILLVQSSTGRREAPIFPIGLAYLAGQLGNHDLRVLDLSCHEGRTDVLMEEVRRFEPHLVALSLRNIDDSSWPVTHSYVPPFSAAVECLEDWRGVVVAGGTGFSIYPDIILEKHPRIDFGIPGEGEISFTALINYIDRGTPIRGWDGGRLLQAVRPDLSEIELPDYSIFDMKPYMMSDGVGVQSRRGCPYGCTYCTYGFLSGKTFRHRPVSHVMADIENLAELGVKSFQFVDSIFNRPDEYFKMLVAAMESLNTGMKWGAWLDMEITPEQLKSMARAGCGKVDYSPDALTARGLRMLGKRSDPHKFYPAVRAAREARFQVGVNFFNGNPGEGFAALLGKLAFMIKARLSLGWSNTFVNLGTIRVYAHSPIAGQMLEDGRVPADCDFYKPVFCRRRGPSDWLFRLLSAVKRARHRQ